MIALGVCTGLENARILAELGYDYIETALNALAAMTEEEFRQSRRELSSAGIPCRAVNCMLPGTIPVVGPQADQARTGAYLERAFDRAGALGVRVAVFGSGGSRRVPEGFPWPRAWRQILEFLSLAEKFAARSGLEIAIEPLRRQECNLLNYVSEAVELASLAGLPHVGVLADTYHMAGVGEPLDVLCRTGGLLRHVHIAEPSERRFPKPGDGQDYDALREALKAAGYSGGVSIEAGSGNLAFDGKEAFQLLDQLRRGE